MAKILVLSHKDNPKLAKVCDELYRKKHQVDVLAMQERLPETRYDVYSSIILDMRRTQSSGKIADFCKYLKQSSRQRPVFILSDNQCIAEKIATLANGADEYMTEPINLAEMEAKLRAVLRRHPPETEQVLQFADMHLERSACRVKKGSEYIDLFPMEFKLLEFFMKHPDTIFSSEVLYQRVWDSSKAQNVNTVRTHIKTLRRKITSALIKTVHGKGYKFSYPSAGAVLKDPA